MIRQAYDEAQAGHSNLPRAVRELDGMSGWKYRMFINNLIGVMESPRYLEIGVWRGSTFCGALAGNPHAFGTAIDNWSQFGGPKDACLSNIGRLCPPHRWHFFEADFRAFDYQSVAPHNVYLFDGPHEYQDQYDGLTLAQPALADEFVYICDDWNWPQVREATRAAIRDLGLTVVDQIEIRTTLDDTHPVHSGPRSEWHNGYFIAEMRK